jgi:hypothetical protein
MTVLLTRTNRSDIIIEERMRVFSRFLAKTGGGSKGSHPAAAAMKAAQALDGGSFHV